MTFATAYKRTIATGIASLVVLSGAVISGADTARAATYSCNIRVDDWGWVTAGHYSGTTVQPSSASVTAAGKEAQCLLKYHGYDPGTVDGIFGSKSQAAREEGPAERQRQVRRGPRRGRQGRPEDVAVPAEHQLLLVLTQPMGFHVFTVGTRRKVRGWPHRPRRAVLPAPRRRCAGVASTCSPEVTSPASRRLPDLLAVAKTRPEVRRTAREHIGGLCSELLVCAGGLPVDVNANVGEGSPVTLRWLCPPLG
ncbi:peptidoglycan-binding domain-containing protein [Streptomyces sp. SAI-129]|uniref:peptidoglycan-binding domain-containing protein n=1 Tax=Streptomyces sp. SAI-129 TaxID=3377727 RepID=UPI003C7C0836